MEKFLEHEIPASPVNSLTEAFHDVQLAANDMVVKVSHPEAGDLQLLGIPYKFDGTPCKIRRPPPRLGEHTDEVMHDLLGLDVAAIDELRAAGIL